MNPFKGQTLSWELKDDVIELALHRDPCNEIGSLTLEELEKFASALERTQGDAHALILYSRLKSGFCAGADLRELYHRAQGMEKAAAARGVREFLERIHKVMNAIDGAPLTTIAALNGVTFGGGFELALVCDLIVADKMARFCFPELRLGLIPGFGGIPRLKRDLGNAVVRDLLLTGRSFNATKAQQVGLVSQVVGEGESLKVARATAAQLGKVRPPHRGRGQEVHKTDPIRGTAAGDRTLLRTLHPTGGRSRTEKVRGKQRRATLLAVTAFD